VTGGPEDEGRAPTSRPKRGSISIVIADSNPVFRGVLRLACKDSARIRIVGEAGDDDGVADLCQNLHPDVLVLAIHSPDAFRLVERLNEGGTRPRTVIVSGLDGNDAVYRARVLGVEAFLDQATVPKETVRAIELVFQGDIVYTDDHDRKALKHLASVVDRARMRERALATLTLRELEILRLLAAGLSNRQLGRRLGIATRTVESHESKIYRKLEARTRMEAVAKAISLNLIDLDSP
jgi:DNA-binding NarL/FixJ family response regulator